MVVLSQKVSFHNCGNTTNAAPSSLSSWTMSIFSVRTLVSFDAHAMLDQFARRPSGQECDTSDPHAASPRICCYSVPYATRTDLNLRNRAVVPCGATMYERDYSFVALVGSDNGHCRQLGCRSRGRHDSVCRRPSFWGWAALHRESLI